MASGKPKRIKGEEIPLSGRVMSIAGAYDALINKRVYKPVFPHEQTIEIIIQGKGHHFDPELIEALSKVEDKFINIANKYRDNEV